MKYTKETCPQPDTWFANGGRCGWSWACDECEDNPEKKAEAETPPRKGGRMADLNFDELEKDWEDHFYESEWEPDTLQYTETEKKIVEELTTFLPRHMAVYDWNLPYAEEIILIFRRHLKKDST